MDDKFYQYCSECWRKKNDVIACTECYKTGRSAAPTQYIGTELGYKLYGGTQ